MKNSTSYFVNKTDLSKGFHYTYTRCVFKIFNITSLKKEKRHFSIPSPLIIFRTTRSGKELFWFPTERVSFYSPTPYRTWYITTEIFRFSYGRGQINLKREKGCILYILHRVIVTGICLDEDGEKGARGREKEMRKKKERKFDNRVRIPRRGGVQAIPSLKLVRRVKGNEEEEEKKPRGKRGGRGLKKTKEGKSKTVAAIKIDEPPSDIAQRRGPRLISPSSICLSR